MSANVLTDESVILLQACIVYVRDDMHTDVSTSVVSINFQHECSSSKLKDTSDMYSKWYTCGAWWYMKRVVINCGSMGLLPCTCGLFIMRITQVVKCRVSHQFYKSLSPGLFVLMSGESIARGEASKFKRGAMCLLYLK